MKRGYFVRKLLVGVVALVLLTACEGDKRHVVVSKSAKDGRYCIVTQLATETSERGQYILDKGASAQTDCGLNAAQYKAAKVGSPRP